MTKSTKPGTQINIRLSDAEHALLIRLAAIHGGTKAAIVAGLKALETPPQSELERFGRDIIKTAKARGLIQ